MEASQVTSIRERLGLSVEALGELMGVHRSTVQRWERGIVDVPKPVAIALRALDAGFSPTPPSVAPAASSEAAA